MLGKRYLLPGVLLLLAVACGSDAVPATSIPPTSAPFVPRPTSTSIADVSPGVAELLGLERVRDFPEELKSGSPPLDPEEAAEITRAFLSDTRFAGREVTDFCSDGSGQIVAFGGEVGEIFHWEVLPNPVGSWNEPAVWMYMDALDPARVSAVATFRWFLDEEVIDKKNPGEVFDNPTCGQ